MKTHIQLKQTKSLPLVLLIATATIFTSCAPKYGCYYSMTETNAPANVECHESMSDDTVTSFEARVGN